MNSILIRLKIFAVLITGTLFSFGQTQSVGWSKKNDRIKCFIENRGQFDLPAYSDKVNYVFDNGNTRICLTNKGVSFNYVKIFLNEESEDKEQYEEQDKNKTDHELDVIKFIWEGADTAATVIAENIIPGYFSYSFKDRKGNEINKNYIPAYEKITYKNLYPNIDVEYVFHPTEGIKYSLILYPGADPSIIKMKYQQDDHMNLVSGNLKIKTKFGYQIDHAPRTFYADDTTTFISSNFVKSGNSITFILDNYNTTQKVIIDPWTVSPNYVSNWDCVWECDKDGAGNVYTIGGVNPMVLTKYNAAGTFQWSYNTPYDTSSWLGTLATDIAGNSYVTNGTYQAIIKVNAAGALVFSNGSPGGAGILTEFWSIAFNCDQTKLVVGGTGGTGLTPTPYVYDVSTSTGAVLASKKVAGGGGLLNSQEVRAITPCGNSKYFWLAHDTIGWLHQNFTFCPTGVSSYKRGNSYSLSYKCENWRYNNSGICAIKANTNFVYTHKGSTIDKRDLNTAVILSSAAVPGGAFASAQVRNSGIDIDACGNVYVGSANQVVKYDANLVQLATYATTFYVYDVHVSTGGNIIACGASGTSASNPRTGYIQSIAAGACSTLALVCCDYNICGPMNICLPSGTIALTANTPGGTWSGTGVSPTGVFTPSDAVVGANVISYSLACGVGTTTITIAPSCTGVQVCLEANGSLTASNGVGPYTWAVYMPASTTAITNSAQCVACGKTWFFGSCLGGTVCNVPAYWSNISLTANSGTLAGIFPIRVTDNGTGISYTISSLSGIPNCISILPVELVNFSGECLNNETTLKWTTATEKNNNYFAIEGSKDGQKFSHIKSVSGAGNSNTYMNYQSNLGVLDPEINYFRIKQVDHSGKVTYHKIIYISCKNKRPESTVRPNPAKNNAFVDLYSENDREILFTITDALGRIVYKKTQLINSGFSNVALDMNQLMSGVYFLNISYPLDQSSEPENIKFILE